jgi:hemoglobin-like flavoprotein
MTEDQIELVRATWPRIEAVADDAATAFYERLFDLDPQVSALFAATDMRSQRQKLMLTLGEIVRDLSEPESLFRRLADLGRRHRAYGVRASHYRLVGEALQAMLADVLKDDYTPEAAEAWRAAYTHIAAAMQGRNGGRNRRTG